MLICFVRKQLARIAQSHSSPEPRSLKSLFQHFFCEYGAGSHLLAPLTRWRYWNRFCWAIIVAGIIGWIVALWFLRSFTE
jgi:hypothetical protein